MTAETVVSFWLAIAAWFVVGWLLFFVWPKTAVAIARQHLFEIRDRLFDCAANGEVSFESARYRMARNVLNAMIRNADHTALLRYALYSRAIKKHKAQGIGEPMRKLRTDSSTPVTIRSALNDADRVCTYLIALRNPVVATVVVSGAVVLRAGKRIKATRRAASAVERRVEAGKRVAVEADIAIDLNHSLLPA